jgi:hypothetical protein
VVDDVGFCDFRQARSRITRTAADERRHSGAFVLQQPFADGPPLVDFTDEVFLLGNCIVEKRFAERRRAADQANRFYRDAGLIHRQQYKTDAFVFRNVGIGSYQREHPVGVLGTRGPDLLAVDQK